MTAVQFFDFNALGNRLIGNEIIIGKYTARLFLIAYQGEPIKLDIDLKWQAIDTTDIFASIGEFCGAVGSAQKVEIGAQGASIRLLVIKEPNSGDTIVDLARAIERIRNTLIRCLSPECPNAESNGLDNPNSQKSKDAKTIEEWYEHRRVAESIKNRIEQEKQLSELLDKNRQKTREEVSRLANAIKKMTDEADVKRDFWLDK